MTYLGCLLLAAAVLEVSSVPLGIYDGDICKKLEGRRYFLQEGRSASLYVKNLDKSKAKIFPIRNRGHYRNTFNGRMRRDTSSASNSAEMLNIVDDGFKETSSDLPIKYQTSDLMQMANSMYSDRTPYLNSLQETAKSKYNEDNINDVIEKPNGVIMIGYKDNVNNNYASLDEINLSKMNNPLDLDVHKSGNLDATSRNLARNPSSIKEFPGMSDPSEVKPQKINNNQKINLKSRNTGNHINYMMDVFHGEDEINNNSGYGSAINQFETDPNILHQKKLNKKNKDPTTLEGLDAPLVRCGVEVVTCSWCHLEFTINEMALQPCSLDNKCRCDHLRLQEPPYVPAKSKTLCSSMNMTSHPVFTTLTEEASIDFFYARSHEVAFVITVSAKINEYMINGSDEYTTTGYITSPYFPQLYPKDFRMKYEITAPSESQYVQILFEDFHISPWSFVQIQDTNKSRVAQFNGNIFRPPVLISSGSTISLKFKANGETGRGFKLKYNYITLEQQLLKPPITDCGGYVMNFGGAITMMNMASPGVNSTISYDCVWIIQPPQDYAFKSHISIRVDQFQDMESGTILEIRQGLTSNDYLLESLEWRSAQPRTGDEYVVAVDTGFYVRLRGSFSHKSKLAIVYTTFSYLGSCFALTDLMCHNHRCVPKMLRCDGFDHCGDNSDEPTSCYGGPGVKLTPSDSAWWYKHTPNYYFPQKNIFQGGHGSDLLLFSSLLTLIIVMIGLVSYLIRQGNVQHTHRRRREGRHISSLNDGVEIFDASADDPPDYEAPPDYDDVIKFILSGNNLKLVRRPGGVTAWVPNTTKTEDELLSRERIPLDRVDFSRKSSRRIRRTRHSSLDLEQATEVVLWDNNVQNSIKKNNESNQSESERPERGHVPSPPPVPLTELRRTLPDSTEISKGHSLSMAHNFMNEFSQLNDSMRYLSTTSTSRDNSDLDMSAPGTSGEVPPQVSRDSPVPSSSRSSIRSNVSESKRKKKGRSSKKKESKSDNFLPPPYEVAIKQITDEIGYQTNYTESSESEADGLRQSENRRYIDTEEQTPARISSDALTDNSGREIDMVSDQPRGHLDCENNNNNGRNLESNAYNRDMLHPDEISLENCQNKKSFTRKGKYASAKSRVHAARELFQKMNEAEKRNQLEALKASKLQTQLSNQELNGRDSIKGLSGTVKDRKAMLFNEGSSQCSCSGACSCKVTKNQNKTKERDTDATESSKQGYRHRQLVEINSSLESLSSTCPDEASSLISNISGDEGKSSKIIRRNSMPSFRKMRNRDLDIYFSQKEESSSPFIEDIERPLITPPINRHIKNPFIQPTKNKAPDPKINNLVKFYSTLDNENVNSSAESLQAEVKSKKACAPKIPPTKLSTTLKYCKEFPQINGNSNDEASSPLSYSTFINSDTPSPDTENNTSKILEYFSQEILSIENCQNNKINQDLETTAKSGAIPKRYIKKKHAKKSGVKNYQCEFSNPGYIDSEYQESQTSNSINLKKEEINSNSVEIPKYIDSNTSQGNDVESNMEIENENSSNMDVDDDIYAIGEIDNSLSANELINQENSIDKAILDSIEHVDTGHPEVGSVLDVDDNELNDDFPADIDATSTHPSPTPKPRISKQQDDNDEAPIYENIQEIKSKLESVLDSNTPKNT